MSDEQQPPTVPPAVEPPVVPPVVAPQYGAYPPPPAPPQYGSYPPAPTAAPPQYGAYPPPTNGAGWAPPPKPGLVPLRPLGFGTLLGAPFQVLRRNPGPTFGSALIIQFALYLVAIAFVGGATFLAVTRLQQASSADSNTIAAGSFAIILLAALVPAALALVSSALLQGILVTEVSREVLGEKRRMGELWRAAARRLWPLLLWILLEAVVVIVVLAVAVGIVVALASAGTVGIALAVIAGLLFALGLLALGIWLGTKLSLVPCVIVLERVGVRRAIGRSWRLTRGSFWRTFGVEALVAVIVWFASQVVTQPVNIILTLAFGLLNPNDGSDSGTANALIGLAVTNLIVGVLQIVFGAITAVVQAGAISVLYVDLRMRREGLDLELIRYVDARQAGLVTADDDPFWVYEAVGEPFRAYGAA